MRPNISEFSYGFALTDELVHRLPRISAAPIFPSLFREGQAGGGWDVMLELGAIPLFLQFKLCDLMTRSTAFEARQRLLQCPFYRMHLRPARHSRQHEMLLELERAGQLVYYVAPAFHELSELNDAFRAGDVIQRSIWVRPTVVGDIADDDDHCISFDLRGNAYLCSTPKRLEQPVTWEAMREKLSAALERHRRSNIGPRDVIEQTLRALIEFDRGATTLRDSSAPGAPGQYPIDADRHPLERLAFYARAILDAHLFLVNWS